MKKLVRPYTVILALVLLVIVVTILLLRHQTDKWVPIKVGPTVSAVYGLGTVKSDAIFNLKSAVANSLSQVYVYSGQHVAKGQPLIRYHDGQQIKAPFSGVITNRQKHNYEVVDPQAPILTLVSTTHCYVQVSLDQSAAIAVKKGMPVVINFEAQYQLPFHGTVQSVYSSGSNFYVRITPNQLPSNILPGMTGDVAIIIKKVPNALQVPLSAIKNNQVTFKIRKQVKTVPITVGVKNDQWAQITSHNIPRQAQVKVH